MLHTSRWHLWKPQKILNRNMPSSQVGCLCHLRVILYKSYRLGIENVKNLKMSNPDLRAKETSYFCDGSLATCAARSEAAAVRFVARQSTSLNATFRYERDYGSFQKVDERWQVNCFIWWFGFLKYGYPQSSCNLDWPFP